MIILKHRGDRMMYPSAQFRKKIKSRSLNNQFWRLNKLMARHMIIQNPYLGLKLRTCSTSVPRDAPWQKAAAANSWSRFICTQESKHLNDQTNWCIWHINCNTFSPFHIMTHFFYKWPEFVMRIRIIPHKQLHYIMIFSFIWYFMSLW